MQDAKIAEVDVSGLPGEFDHLKGHVFHVANFVDESLAIGQRTVEEILKIGFFRESSFDVLGSNSSLIVQETVGARNHRRTPATREFACALAHPRSQERGKLGEFGKRLQSLTNSRERVRRRGTGKHPLDTLDCGFCGFRR
jgi:hypothetical protein